MTIKILMILLIVVAIIIIYRLVVIFGSMITEYLKCRKQAEEDYLNGVDNPNNIIFDNIEDYKEYKYKIKMIKIAQKNADKFLSFKFNIRKFDNLFKKFQDNIKFLYDNKNLLINSHLIEEIYNMSKNKLVYQQEVAKVNVIKKLKKNMIVNLKKIECINIETKLSSTLNLQNTLCLVVKLFKLQNNMLYGIFYKDNNKYYYILVSAYDIIMDKIKSKERKELVKAYRHYKRNYKTDSIEDINIKSLSSFMGIISNCFTDKDI